MTDQNQGSIDYVFSNEMRILMGFNCLFSFTFFTEYAIFELSHIRRKIVSIVRIRMICRGINMKCLLHFPFRSTNYRYFFENISWNYLSNVPRQVDILDGKQTTNHKRFIEKLSPYIISL